MNSDEGLNAYGASTWGQFFIYQGFNRHMGWMHTSSGVDSIDEFAETVAKRPAAAGHTATAPGAARSRASRSRVPSAGRRQDGQPHHHRLSHATTARSSARTAANGSPWR